MQDPELEKQYLSDLLAARPVAASERRIARSALFRRRVPVHCDLAYGTHERQKLDVFLPPGNGPWPLMVFIHGGYWRRGSKNEWAALAEGWVERGVAVATIGYRLLPEVRLPDVIADVCDALRLLGDRAERLQLDVSRVAISGTSAGAHLAAMVAASGNPRRLRPKAAVLLSGVYDPRPLEYTSLAEVVGESLVHELPAISPLGLAPPADCACMVVWGDQETDAFQSQSRTLARYWANWGFEAPEHAMAGKNHFTIVDCLFADADGPVASFIERILLGE